MFEDDYPFPKVGYVSFLEGNFCRVFFDVVSSQWVRKKMTFPRQQLSRSEKVQTYISTFTLSIFVEDCKSILLGWRHKCMGLRLITKGLHSNSWQTHLPGVLSNIQCVSLLVPLLGWLVCPLYFLVNLVFPRFFWATLVLNHQVLGYEPPGRNLEVRSGASVLKLWKRW